MNAGIEINAVYEKFVSIFAYMAGMFDRAKFMEASFPLLSEVSDLLVVPPNSCSLTAKSLN